MIKTWGNNPRFRPKLHIKTGLQKLTLLRTLQAKALRIDQDILEYVVPPFKVIFPHPLWEILDLPLQMVRV